MASSTPDRRLIETIVILRYARATNSVEWYVCVLSATVGYDREFCESGCADRHTLERQTRVGRGTIITITIIIWPSVDIFPREFKNWDIQNWVQISQSVQSGVGKLSCNKKALKRCTSTEILWNRKAPSSSSPEDEEIFLPKLPKSWHYYYLFIYSHQKMHIKSTNVSISSANNKGQLRTRSLANNNSSKKHWGFLLCGDTWVNIMWDHVSSDR